jgi:hypothetical protein
MSKKVVIHIFHADESSLGIGSHVAERIRQVMDDRGTALEVYVFGPAEKALADPANTKFRETLASLATHGVPVHTCRSIAEDLGKTEAFTQLGLTLEFARDAFIRYAVEGAAVISF